jgi:hypothetical protein
MPGFRAVTRVGGNEQGAATDGNGAFGAHNGLQRL